ncbi:SEC-C domain-containing protein [Candidatus Parcubacteria bacterium]|nr:SEC-C domain-containing protein [Candidatus Parcubacteria bacterium]
MDEAQKDKLMATCSCGSGKKYGECCGKEEKCFCGSDKAAKDCCMATPGEHAAM